MGPKATVLASQTVSSVDYSTLLLQPWTKQQVAEGRISSASLLLVRPEGLKSQYSPSDLLELKASPQEALDAFQQKTRIKLQKQLPSNSLIHAPAAETAGQSWIRCSSTPLPASPRAWEGCVELSRAHTSAPATRDTRRVSQAPVCTTCVTTRDPDPKRSLVAGGLCL